MAPSRVVGLAQSSSSSGIFFQPDGHSQAVIHSHLTSSFGNSSTSVPGTARSNLVPVSGDVKNTVLSSVANSGTSVGASSLVTDANSEFSGGAHLQRSASFNNESYMRMPASPLSFSSNNLSISGSSVMDGSSVVQQNAHQDHTSHQFQQNQLQSQQGASSATSFPTSQTGQVSLPLGALLSGSLVPDHGNFSQLQKKARLDAKQEDILSQQVLQLQGRNPQLQALLQQQRFCQQQQILQSMPQLQRAQLQQQLQRQAMQPTSPMKRPYDGAVCSRRLMQYLYHQRQRPPDNSIAYWRKFVTEYYSPRAKKRWCLSLYDNDGHHALGVFPQAAMDAWQCDICGSKSGRGFEATYEVLPRLNEIKFGNGVIDELLFLDLPHEYRFNSGVMMLEYGKAVQESVYEQLRVVCEGQLRIIFSNDLKILSWEFCARRHEELLPRRLIAPQVNQLVQVAQKCQSTNTEGGSEGVSLKDLEANSNMMLTASRQLAKSLELQSLNDLGFSKRYVRCLQISQVVNTMKDLIDFSCELNIGPIEGLKNYPRHAAASRLRTKKMQELEHLANVQARPTDRNTLNKLMAMHPSLNNQVNSSPQLVGRGALSGAAQAALALSTYQNTRMRPTPMDSNPSSHQPDASSSINHGPSSSFQGNGPLIPGSMDNFLASGFSSPNLPTSESQMHGLAQRFLTPNGLLQQSHRQGPGNQALQHRMIQQFLQMSNAGSGPNPSGNMTRSGGIGYGRSPSLSSPATSNLSGINGPGLVPSQSGSFKGVSIGNSSVGSVNNKFSQRAQDSQEDSMMQDIANDFLDNGFFNSDFDAAMDNDWKA